MFIGTFLSLLLYNVPKYAMANVLTDEYQTYYSILFMPSFVITLMCEFVFKPTITTIAQLWWENDLKKIHYVCSSYHYSYSVCCAGIVVGGHLIGRTLLEIIYGVDLSPYKLQFIVLLIGGGIGAEVYMLYNILIASRWGKCMLPVYSVTAGYYNCCCKNYGKPVGNYGSFFELPAFLLYFICTFCLNSDFCNSSEKASKIMSDYIKSPRKKGILFRKPFFPGIFYLPLFF